MNYSFSELHQFLYGNDEKSFTDALPKNVDEAKTKEILASKQKKRKEQLKSFFLDPPKGVLHNKPEKLKKFQEFLLEERKSPEVQQSIDYVLETLFTDTGLKPVSVEKKPEEKASAGDMFDQLDAQYGYFPAEEKEAAKADYIKLFRVTHFIVSVLEGRKETPDADNITIAKKRAYKLLVAFGKKNKPGFSSVDTYFNGHVKSQQHEKPLYKTLSKLKLPKRKKGDGQRPLGEKVKLEDWRQFILKNGDKALYFFQFAESIEKFWTPPRAPKTMEEAERARLSTGYRRVAENPSLGLLCVRHHLSEKSFNTCLEVLKTKAALEIEAKSPIANNLPDVTIHGAELGLPGYCLVRLPKDDVNAFVLGKLTNCCQSIGGNSENCVIDGVLRKNNGFYVLLQAKEADKEAKSPVEITGEGKKINYRDYKIVGQAYAWISSSGSLTFDSWENLTPKRDDAIAVRMLTEFAKKISQPPESKVMRVTIGTGGKTPKELKDRPRTYLEFMQEGYNYGDAANQVEIYENAELKAANLAELKAAIPEYDTLPPHIKTPLESICVAKSDFVRIKELIEFLQNEAKTDAHFSGFCSSQLNADHFSYLLEITKLGLLHNKPLIKDFVGNTVYSGSSSLRAKLIFKLKSLQSEGARLEWVVPPLLKHASGMSLNYNWVKIFRALKKAKLENDQETVQAALANPGASLALIKIAQEFPGEEKYNKAVRDYYSAGCDLLLMTSPPTATTSFPGRGNAYILVQAAPGVAPSSLYFVDRMSSAPSIKKITDFPGGKTLRDFNAVFDTATNYFSKNIIGLSDAQLKQAASISGHAPQANPQKTLDAKAYLKFMKENSLFEHINTNAELKAWILLHKSDADANTEFLRLINFIAETKALGFDLPPPSSEYPLYDKPSVSAVIKELKLKIARQQGINPAIIPADFLEGRASLFSSAERNAGDPVRNLLKNIRDKSLLDDLLANTELRMWIMLAQGRTGLEDSLNRLVNFIGELKAFGLSLPKSVALRPIYSIEYIGDVINEFKLELLRQQGINPSEFPSAARFSRTIETKAIPELVKLKNSIYYTNPDALRVVADGEKAESVINALDTLAREGVKDERLVQFSLEQLKNFPHIIEIIKFLRPEETSYRDYFLSSPELLPTLSNRVKLALQEGLAEDPSVRKLIFGNGAHSSYLHEKEQEEKQFNSEMDLLIRLKKEGFFFDRVVKTAVLADAKNEAHYIRAMQFLREQKLDGDAQLKREVLYQVKAEAGITTLLDAFNSAKSRQPDLDPDFLRAILLSPRESEMLIAAYQEIKKQGPEGVVPVVKKAALENPAEIKSIIQVVSAAQGVSPEFRKKIFDQLEHNSFSLGPRLKAINLYSTNIHTDESDVQAAILRFPESAQFIIDSFKQLKENNMLHPEVRAALYSTFDFEFFDYEKKSILESLILLKENGLYDNADIRLDVIKNPSKAQSYISGETTPDQAVEQPAFLNDDFGFYVMPNRYRTCLLEILATIVPAASSPALDSAAPPSLAVPMAAEEDKWQNKHDSVYHGGLTLFHEVEKGTSNGRARSQDAPDVASTPTTDPHKKT